MGGGGDMAEPSEAGDAPPDDGPPGELGPDGPDGPEEKGRPRFLPLIPRACGGTAPVLLDG